MFKRFIIATVLTALAMLMGVTVQVSTAGAATAKRCATAGKQYQSWVVFAKDRKVGDAKTKKVRRRGVGGVVDIVPLGSAHPDGEYYLTIKPKNGCEVLKVELKTRRGLKKKIRSSTGGLMRSLKRPKGASFPYREVRVWTRKARRKVLPCVVPDIVHRIVPSFPPSLSGKIRVGLELERHAGGGATNRYIWTALNGVRFREAWVYVPPEYKKGRRLSTGPKRGVYEIYRAPENPDPVGTVELYACGS